ncbi:MAG: DUF2520 domain-containing protein [Actinomycetota bacterium]|nr:DUF2520 domain-containing protein [Actinomycetota bacterium]
MNSSEPELALRVALVGAGNVGTSVALLLAGAGHSIVGAASRSTSSATRAAEVLDTKIFDYSFELPECDLVLIGATEGGIAEIARSLAPHIDVGAYAWHFAGSLGTDALGAISDAGGRVAAAHPVQAIPDVDRGVHRLPGSAWGITASERDRDWVASLVRRDLTGTPVFVAEDDRVVWHAASVTVSNGAAALLGAGEQILASIGIEDPQSVLGPLAAGTIANAMEAGGGARTLTGPVVRGEVDTVRRHLFELARRDPELAQNYRRVGQTIVRVAARSGRITDEVARSLYELLAVA